MSREHFTTIDNRNYPLWRDVEEALSVIASAYTSLTREGRRSRGWIFRGQSCSQWKLEAAIYRKASSPSDIAKREVYTQTFLKALKELSKKFWLPLPSENSELLAIAQHYGFPTSLLDFTWNPTIAAFFAASNNPTHDKVGVIFAFSIKEYEQMRNPFSVWGTDQKKAEELMRNHGMEPLPPTLIIEPENVPRIRAQEAVFLDASSNSAASISQSCIDRFYFGHQSFTPAFIKEMKERLFPSSDRIAKFVEEWKKSNPFQEDNKL